MSNPSQPLYIATLAIGLALSPLAAVAQTTGTAQQPTAGATQPVSGEKLDSFILAMVEIAEIRQTYAPKLANAASEDERQALLVEGNELIEQRVDDVPGITLNEYVEIATAASEDAALGERINKRLDAMQDQ